MHCVGSLKADYLHRCFAFALSERAMWPRFVSFLVPNMKFDCRLASGLEQQTARQGTIICSAIVSSKSEALLQTLC